MGAGRDGGLLRAGGLDTGRREGGALGVLGRPWAWPARWPVSVAGQLQHGRHGRHVAGWCPASSARAPASVSDVGPSPVGGPWSTRRPATSRSRARRRRSAIPSAAGAAAGGRPADVGEEVSSSVAPAGGTVRGDGGQGARPATLGALGGADLAAGSAGASAARRNVDGGRVGDVVTVAADGPGRRLVRAVGGEQGVTSVDVEGGGGGGGLLGQPAASTLGSGLRGVDVDVERDVAGRPSAAFWSQPSCSLVVTPSGSPW